MMELPGRAVTCGVESNGVHRAAGGIGTATDHHLLLLRFQSQYRGLDVENLAGCD